MESREELDVYILKNKINSSNITHSLEGLVNTKFY